VTGTDRQSAKYPYKPTSPRPRPDRTPAEPHPPAGEPTLRTTRQQAWRESGLGAPIDIDQLQHRVTQLEQLVSELRGQLNDREQELDAARAANRELIINVNRR
jgi:hypothetical protein